MVPGCLAGSEASEHPITTPYPPALPDRTPNGRDSSSR